MWPGRGNCGKVKFNSPTKRRASTMRVSINIWQLQTRNAPCFFCFYGVTPLETALKPSSEIDHGCCFLFFVTRGKRKSPLGNYRPRPQHSYYSYIDIIFIREHVLILLILISVSYCLVHCCGHTTSSTRGTHDVIM